MPNEIKLTFAGDASKLTRSFDAVGDSALDMAKDLDKADDGAGRLSTGVSSMNEKIDASESKFMGAADLADGLASTLGINVGPTIEYARAFGDMAGGFTALVGPALEGVTKKLQATAVAQKASAGAQALLNAVMKANPLFMVIGLLALLVGGFVLAYKKSETFRTVVHAAMDGVKKAVQWVGDKFSWLWNKIRDTVDSAAGKFKGLAEIITTPYRTAFNGIATLWNNTVGRLSFTIPGWVPGIGGNGFDVPDIPTFANGGVMTAGQVSLVGERGPELVVPGRTSTVIPNHQLGGGGVTVVIGAPGDPLVEAIKKTVRIIGGGNVQRAFGGA